MKDPTRLLDAPASELERHLLRAGAAEQPPSAAMKRLADTLGVSASIGEHTHAAPSKLPLLAANKGALAIGVATLATLAAVGWLATRSGVHPGPSGPTSEPQQSSNAPSENVVPMRGALPNMTTAAAHESNSLAQEIARIDAVRRDLAANRTKSAVAGLQDYQRDFPSGVLRQEAELLSIEAHRQAGDRRRARTLAFRFLANNPDSPHSARVRDLLQDLGPDAR